MVDVRFLDKHNVLYQSRIDLVNVVLIHGLR